MARVLLAMMLVSVAAATQETPAVPARPVHVQCSQRSLVASGSRPPPPRLRLCNYARGRFCLHAPLLTLHPCLRLRTSAGRPIRTFARFATVDLDLDTAGPAPGACELSREKLVRMLDASTDAVRTLNASLPPDFFERRAVMTEDCATAAPFGMQLYVALLEYQADCFRITNGGANCTLKRALGAPWDALFDTPFDWKEQGFQSCAGNDGGGYGDYTETRHSSAHFARSPPTILP